MTNVKSSEDIPSLFVGLQMTLLVVYFIGFIIPFQFTPNEVDVSLMWAWCSKTEGTKHMSWWSCVWLIVRLVFNSFRTSGDTSSNGNCWRSWRWVSARRWWFLSGWNFVNWAFTFFFLGEGFLVVVVFLEAFGSRTINSAFWSSACGSWSSYSSSPGATKPPRWYGLKPSSTLLSRNGLPGGGERRLLSSLFSCLLLSFLLHFLEYGRPAQRTG